MILMRIAEARMPELYKRRVEQTNLLDIDPTSSRLKCSTRSQSTC